MESYEAAHVMKTQLERFSAAVRPLLFYSEAALPFFLPAPGLKSLTQVTAEGRRKARKLHKLQEEGNEKKYSGYCFIHVHAKTCIITQSVRIQVPSTQPAALPWRP